MQEHLQKLTLFKKISIWEMEIKNMPLTLASKM